MKGTIFQKPLELNLTVDGESWHQGDAVAGTLAVKNHSDEPYPLESIHVQLAQGELKKVRLKSPEAFKIISSLRFNEKVTVIAPKAEAHFAWRFNTDRNCPITDTAVSLFLLYGQQGQIQLPFRPFWVMEEILKLFEVHFRFVFKSQKFNKGRVEMKLAPPSSRSFASVGALLLSFWIDQANLEIDYRFEVKKVEATASSFELKKLKNSYTRVYLPEQYLTTSGRFHHEKMEYEIREVLALVEAKILF